jgi:hypothetical protein
MRWLLVAPIPRAKKGADFAAAFHGRRSREVRRIFRRAVFLKRLVKRLDV